MNAVRSKDRLFSLDVLRGLAAGMVLCRHLPVGPRLDLSWTEYAVKGLWRIGWCGVDLFFVLSGFLISTLLFREFNSTGTLDVRRFWIRRGLKIWPSYYIAYGTMVLVCVIHAFSAGESTRANQLLANVLPNAVFIQNYCDARVRWDNSWSIAIEEHFYLCLPLLLLVLAWQRGRRNTESGPGGWFRPLLALGLILGVGLLLLRVYKTGCGNRIMEIYYPSHLRADSLFCGVVAAYLFHYKPDWVAGMVRHWPLLLLLVPLALAVPLFWQVDTSAVTLTLGFTLLYLAFGGVVLLAGVHSDFGSQGPILVTWPVRFLAWLGVYSYGVYLGHSVIINLPWFSAWNDWIMSCPPSDVPLAGIWLCRLSFIGLSIGAAVLLTHAVERPFLRLRDRIFPSRSKAAPARPADVNQAMPRAA
jgi:peptidoglycan/LPS O-acetylase OafA/YrhL